MQSVLHPFYVEFLSLTLKIHNYHIYLYYPVACYEYAQKAQKMVDARALLWFSIESWIEFTVLLFAWIALFLDYRYFFFVFKSNIFKKIDWNVFD